MNKSYTYNPTKAAENGVDRMRLELGDTTFAPPELTAALCDEEYKVIISQNPNWRKAKLRCLEAILMRYSHQVDTSHDGISYALSDRVDFWKKLYDELKRNAGISVSSVKGSSGKPPYFKLGMQSNPRKG
ncbi:MAG: hypothetical protein HFE90_09270 [Firmicutes bacterium]|nr:hypothetical protein [Bacillota bacterium]